MEQKEEHKRKTILIGTKVTPEDRGKLLAICDAFGLSIYELIQALLSSLLHYFDTDSNITCEHSLLLNTLYDSNFCKSDTFSPISMKDTRNISATSAIVLLSKPNNSKHTYSRPQALLVNRQGERVTESYNFDSMLRLFLSAVDPDILAALERDKEQQGEFSLLHTLREIVLARATPEQDKDRQFIEGLFNEMGISSGDRINGEVIYKRQRNTTPEGIERTQITNSNKRIRADF